MDELVVTEWTSYGDPRPDNRFGGVPTREELTGGGWARGIGGWVKGHTWPEYLEHVPEDLRPYARALNDAIARDKLWFSGSEHQNGERRVPVFSDGTVARFTMRGWGDIMAASWNTIIGRKHLSYLDFY